MSSVETGPALLSHAARPPRPSALANALTFGWRAVLKFKHVPEQLFDLIMTPLMFTLLFTFVFPMVSFFADGFTYGGDSVSCLIVQNWALFNLGGLPFEGPFSSL